MTRALLQMARRLDLPEQQLAGSFLVELVGDTQLHMEGHRGILSYGEEEIHISAGALVVRVRGAGLELRAMTPTELRVTGKIFGVELV
ncbi:MAG TPA: sporulation protein [Clostridiales bacterium]|nr:sporulation protein [Clostridiales bacterium]